MSEMVERVARALQQRDGTFGSDEPIDPAFIEDARAAIAAMREPTDGMVDAVMAKHIGVPRDIETARELSRNFWRSMIDEALR